MDKLIITLEYNNEIVRYCYPIGIALPYGNNTNLLFLDKDFIQADLFAAQFSNLQSNNLYSLTLHKIDNMFYYLDDNEDGVLALVKFLDINDDSGVVGIPIDILLTHCDCTEEIRLRYTRYINNISNNDIINTINKS